MSLLSKEEQSKVSILLVHPCILLYFVMQLLLRLGAWCDADVTNFTCEDEDISINVRM